MSDALAVDLERQASVSLPSSSCSMPLACVCSCCAASATFWTGETGMPSSAVSHSAEVRCAIRSRTSGSSSSRWASRSGFVRKRGSRASSGRPIAAQSCAKRRSFAAAIISSPSAVGNTSYGAISGNAVPWRPGAMPVRSASVSW